jgi:hypothetical protein
MKFLIFSILFSAVHLAWAVNRVLDLFRILDLFRKSRRKNKTLWMLFILLIPVIGVVAYNFTMKRRKFIF